MIEMHNKYPCIKCVKDIATLGYIMICFLSENLKESQLEVEIAIFSLIIK